ncbi:predicted protein [Postia placenta Mad-698-R]|nr:predicted protein [Postia placenta Mad-698-R]
MRGSMSMNPPEGGLDVPNPRRIRHITSIQVRNLTPFPIRDAFASALKQPSEQPQFTPQGHFSDDVDVTIGRKRARKMSSTSSLALSGSKIADDPPHENGSPGDFRRRDSSRVSASNTSQSTVSSSPTSARRTSTVRPPYRQRTISVASSSFSYDGDLREVSAPGRAPVPDLLVDTSQTGLEKVLQSRLVEAFLTITLPDTASPGSNLDTSHNAQQEGSAIQPPRASTSQANMKSLPRERALTAVRKPDSTVNTTPRRSTVTSSAKPASPRPTTPSRLTSNPTPSRSEHSTMHNKSLSKSPSFTNGRTLKSPSTPPAHKQRLPIPSSMNSPPLSPSSLKSEQLTASGSLSPRLSSTVDLPSTSTDEQLHVPDHISPIHRPSTNPTFRIDARFGGEFVPNADLSGSRMRLEVWGHVKRGLGWASVRETDAKGKGKQRELNEPRELEWRVLEGWDVDLGDLVPLPADLASHPSHLPSNTLLISLSPPGKTYYLPVPASHLHSPLPPSFNSGYSSDPESGPRKAKVSGEVIPGENTRQASERLEDKADAEELDEAEEYASSMRKGKRRTASWQDLLRLINLQTCIIDTQQSLSEVVREIDKTVTHPGAGTLHREVSERAAWVGQLHDETSSVLAESETLRAQISARKEDLRRRRELLALARDANESDCRAEAEREEDLVEERQRLDLLRSQIGPMRSVLITTLSFIFPIELVSPPDLLFTVLDVPLPIPLAQTDPAPPLSLPAHKEVTEDAVATALGYAAQVVQLLAAYMGKGLVYPVTCVGSRSLIKDGISAMVGPRMFPLFTRGVDTYRFEYGVFLLNKDIEILMSDRNLRALDIRHTLPNLKNLLLTLTDSEGKRPPQRFSMASSVSISSLRSPILTASSLPTPIPDTAGSSSNVKTSTALQPDGLPATGSDAHESDSPPRSGATTPTASTPDPAARKARAFLDLSPLAGFLRVRYPSSSRPSVRSVPEVPENAAARDAGAAGANGDAVQSTSGGDAGEDEEDRRTIRGRSDTLRGRSDTLLGAPEEEGKVGVDADVNANANGDGNVHAAHGNGAAEKLSAEDGREHDAPPPGVFVGGVN